ncbi:MAG: homocysteine S-methyltransferase family protein, partial [bacterium]
MDPAYTAIKNKLSQDVVILDGGIGSEIVRRGVRWRQHGLRTDADKVQAIHQDYIRAGADVVTTDTFQLTRRTYLNLFHNLEHMKRIGAPGLQTQAETLAKKAVSLAQAARNEESRAEAVAIAGSVSPINHCFRPDLAPSREEAVQLHSEAVRTLADAGVDLILLETMNTIAEAQVALEAAKQTGLPVWVSFVLAPGGKKVLSGESIADAVKTLEAKGCDAFLVNCAPPEDITSGLEELLKVCRVPAGAYAHIGHYDPPSWKFDFHPQFVDTDACSPKAYAAFAAQWKTMGAKIVGGCCGTTPDHIKA